MRKGKKILGASIVGLAAFLGAGCRSFESETNAKTIPSSLEKNFKDSHTSIDEIISEASKYNPEDVRSKEVSELFSPMLAGLRRSIEVNTRQFVSESAKYIVRSTEDYQHPLSDIIGKGLMQMSYVQDVTYTQYRNTLSTKKIRGREDGTIVVLYFAPPFAFVLIPLELLCLPITVSKLIFGKGTPGDVTGVPTIFYAGMVRTGNTVKRIRFYPYTGKEVGEER